MSIEGNRELHFRVADGNARFADGGAAVSGRAGPDGIVATPALRAGTVHNISSIEITSQGRSLGILRVRIIPLDRWSLFLDILSKDSGVVIERAHEYAVVNTALMRASREGVQQRLGSAPNQVVDAAGAGGAGMRATGVCIRDPFGPGWVNLTTYDPAGWLFSLKPENTWPLVWARAPGQDVDALYNRAWGCYAAIKVPDNCTATSGPDGTSCCCNAAAAAWGHVCEWKNLETEGWPVFRSSEPV